MTDTTQRWRLGHESRRPAGEPIDTARYAALPLDELVAKRFVCTHHYAHSYPAAKYRVGLWHKSNRFHVDRLVGVAVFSQPVNKATIPAYSNAKDGAELGRFVLLDEVPGNGESWFLGQAFRLLRVNRGDLGMIVSYSDPVPRTSEDGVVVKPGHIGKIYQAFNGRYVGRARAENLVLDRRGCVINRRTLSKLRNDERGAEHTYQLLLAAGAPRRRPLEGGRDYVARALREGPFRRVRHPGNHTYLWALRKGVRLTKDGLPWPSPHETSTTG